MKAKVGDQLLEFYGTFVASHTYTFCSLFSFHFISPMARLRLNAKGAKQFFALREILLIAEYFLYLIILLESCVFSSHVLSTLFIVNHQK